ncbi:NAD-dependent epimerase/dehydratase family protein [Actinomadura rayongensis]|uniref:NAD-dependent epimerase/dehydratase family protein n=1 Tax=Actinomadura rayongensis TaxID=1429076 RepID=A0A6I4W3M7_9ACTN|nr:NAD-dependent epimerase/dehydratase family protein [Actinomadura rayongensis]MXQ63035.1 NAD-dependent epimerase/dehydratase family protein [Actinomadura rayongensis]
MSRVVVTGGCGFIGGHLVERLVADGDEVTVFDAAPPGDRRPVPDGVRYVAGDIRDPEAVGAAIDDRTDTVYHLAAVVGVDQYLARPLDVIDINFSGSRTVLDAATRAGARVLMASTSEVFGKNPAVPWREDGDRVLGPTSADRWTYSSSKALTEHLTYAFARQHGTAATVIRYFNVYGPGQRPAYVVSRSVHRALNGLPPVVYDNGIQTRCFTFIEDAVEGTVRAARAAAGAGETFNIGSMTETTVKEVIEVVNELAGFGGPARDTDTREALGPSYEDLSRRVPDSTKARDVLGWSCQVPLEEGLRRTVAWARENPWWLALSDTGAA